MAEMQALSVKQPWAWAIVAGYKDVDNRPRRTNFRGPLLIHAGLEFDPAGFQYLWEMGLYKAVPDTLFQGGLVGMVDVVDCTRRYESDWAVTGFWHWVLAKPREFRNLIACPGRLGMFYPEVSEREHWAKPDAIRSVIVEGDPESENEPLPATPPPKLTAVCVYLF